MNTDINIVPVDYTTTRVVTSFTVNVVALELFNSVTLSVITLDANRGIVDTHSYKLSGAEYLAWNNDDQYIIDYVANKLGFSIASSNSA